MTRCSLPFFRRSPRLLAWAGLALLLTGAAPAWALYKVVGPDGKVTYTDRPPTDAKVQAVKPGASAGPSTEGMPFELARVVSRYPVVLTTGNNCTSCDAGRQLLKARGVPFTEKTVSTTDDVQALQRLEGTDQVPVLRIGGKQVLGYAAGEWTAYLDAAGFPAKSLLPATYRYPAPTPLAPASDKVTSPDAAARPVGTPRSEPAPAEGSTPAGIRF